MSKGGDVMHSEEELGYGWVGGMESFQLLVPWV